VVVTKFTGKIGNAPRLVVLEWVVSGGCGETSVTIARATGNYTFLPVRSPSGTYNDTVPASPPSGAGGCYFTVRYNMTVSGTPAEYPPVPGSSILVDNVNLCG
jgi:hypothetical protein